MAERAILIVRTDNATVVRSSSERRVVSEDLLDLSVAERGIAGNQALPAFPLCCSLVICINLGCSSSSSSSKVEED